ncbi:hypothetical protein RW291109_209 [Cyanophage S-RIM12_RW_29_1109]|uniref:Uncharacterized protein n=7 Tax=Brizovirus TaxID=2733098 RepID=A0A1D7SXJ2_9CAUD|nr:hypothetical protein HOQ64_gp028 [Cyanophage S-RIM12 isolate RW_01_0310]YP_009779401.1 hypothetical protein HOQ65_gp029 [Cyanophage S-RIM12 isolate RW_06_0310]YP_009779616.1 hypothetical protein HOQ66_gp029 [Cyanophage S-RIM12 isolate W1_08_0910]AOO15266.1 hypothetical protein Np140310_208 [Cyanophage S-RIM12_Np_14_0310]AOO15478.1 hypothetical protein Np150310_205 [Cyanophage S-RIM12_Np_15_0310]AOO15693.1 hypothetical protein Np121112_208 [Cyanophage S-RIM12_Np_22_1112]AOO16119.1 hypotheti
MDLPKIKNENLPDKLKEMLGNSDAEFDSLMDPLDALNIGMNLDEYNIQRKETALKLVEARKKLQELRKLERKNKNDSI